MDRAPTPTTKKNGATKKEIINRANLNIILRPTRSQNSPDRSIPTTQPDSIHNHQSQEARC